MKSNRKYAGLLVLIVLLTISPAYAQQFAALKDPQPTYRNFSVMQGLPSSETYFVHQDRQGYMWVCTDRGVARYDGYRFRVFTTRDGLVDDVVFWIYEDRKHRLWFISKKNELCYYERGKIRRYRYNALLRKLITGVDNLSKDLYVDAHDNITFCVRGMAAVHVTADGKAKLLHNDVWEYVEFFEKEDGAHFIVTGLREGHYNKPHNSAIHYSKEGRMTTFDQKIMVRNSLRYVLHQKSFFFSTSDKLYLIRDRRLYQLMKNVNIISLRSEDGDLWIGYANGGVNRYTFDHRTGLLKKKEHFLGNYSVSGIESDSEGGLWFTTLEDGVRYLPHQHMRHLGKGSGLPFVRTTAIQGIRDDVYVVSKHAVLQQLNPPYFRRAQMGKENIYLAAFRGQLLVAGCKEKPRAPSRVRLLVNEGLPAGNFFSGRDHVLLTRVDIEEYDSLLRRKTVYHRKKNELLQSNFLLRDDHGTIYLANRGIFKLNGERIEPALENELGDVVVSGMCFDEQWKCVVATRGQGLVFFDRDSITVRLTTADGLLSNELTFLYIDDSHRIWTGGHEGVNCIHRQHGKWTVRRFTRRNGLPTNEVNGVYVFGKKAWIATNKGISIMQLNSLGKASTRILLEELLASGRVVHEKKPVFPYGTSYVRIRFRTTNYRGAAHHVFRYRLGLGDDWVTTSRPEISLNQPRYGNYSVEVTFPDENGDWLEPVMIASFEVERPFYARWYFIALLVLLGMGGMYLLFRLRIRQINRRNHLQKTINQLEQKALRAQMNPHFIFNSLNSIQSFLIYEENEKAEKYLLRFARLIRQTLNNSRESYIAIESEMETLRGYLELEQMRFKEKFTFEITCGLSADEQQWGVPPMLIQPFVENAVLHGFRTMETGGRIEVRFEKLENQRLLCIVEDNGIGRKATMKAKAEGHKSFGTKITEERLAAFRQKYGDEFSIETVDKEQNGEAAGTKVVMHIPVVRPEEINLSEEA